MWRIAQLHERELGDCGRGDRRLPRDPRRAARGHAGARRAGAAVRGAATARPICSRSSSCAWRSPTSTARRAQAARAAPADRAASSTASAGARRRSSAIARCSTSSRATTRRAPASRSPRRRRSAAARRRGARAALPDGGRARQADPARRAVGASTRPIRASASSRLTQIAAAARSSAGDADAAFEALARAARIGVGEPELPSLLDGIERLAPAAARRQAGRALSRARARHPRRRGAGARLPRGGRRVAQARRSRRRRASTTGACSTRRPITRRRSTRSRRIYSEGREWEPLSRSTCAAPSWRGRRRSPATLSDAAGAAVRGRASIGPMEAIRAYEQVLEMFPHDADAGKALEQRYVGRAPPRRAGRAAREAARLRRGRRRGGGAALPPGDAVRRGSRATPSARSRTIAPRSAAIRRTPAPSARSSGTSTTTDSASPPPRCSSRSTSARHDWPALMRIYQIRLEAADDHRTRLVARQAHRARSTRSSSRISTARSPGTRKVFREEPAIGTTRDQLARLAGVLDNWTQPRRGLRRLPRRRRATESADGVEVLRTLAAIYHARLEDVDRAKAAYQRLLELDANDEAAFFNLEQLLVARQALAGSARRVSRRGRRARSTSRARRRSSTSRRRLHEDELADADAAIDTWRAVARPRRRGRARHRARSIGSTPAGKRWHDLVELTMRRLERVEAGGPRGSRSKLRSGRTSSRASSRTCRRRSTPTKRCCGARTRIPRRCARSSG